MQAARKNPFPRFPLHYVADGFDAGDWTQMEACLDELEARTLRTAKDIERWLLDMNELTAAFSQEDARRYIDMTCHTDDPKLEAAYLSYQRDIVSRSKPRWQALSCRYVKLPARRKLPRSRYAVHDRIVSAQVELFREQNVPLETRETELAQQYQKIMGAMTVTYDGQERTLQQMGRYLEVADPAVRKETWKLVSRRVLRDRNPLDAIFDELVALRGRMARNAGFRNYRDYAFRVRNRFDYGPDECFVYHAAAETVVVPEMKKLLERRRRRLKLDALRPWDLNVDPAGAPPLRPFRTVAELFEGVREIYRRVSPDLGGIFQAFRDRNLLDLGSRRGKAPGGYSIGLEVDRVPFIFMNAAGLHRDVQTLLHEGGHAFHTVLARKDPLVAYRSAPIEFAEVASQGMEMIGLDHLEVFYPKKEAQRARREHLEHVLSILAWVAQIDAFQHRVYTRPPGSRDERRRVWLDLRRRFSGAVEWRGFEDAHASMWHRQSHLFTAPFYYIEYAISLLGALQLWQNARKDRPLAIRKYRQALALGGSRPLPELFEAAGLRFDFSERAVRPLVRAVTEEIEALA